MTDLQSLAQYAPVAFIVAGYLALLIVLTPDTILAGYLLRAGTTASGAASVLKVVRRRRVTPVALALTAGAGAVAGAAVGLVLLNLLGPQGGAMGIALIAVGGGLPLARFQDGWNKRWVAAINGQTLRLLRSVHTYAGMGGLPISESLRAFARTWADKSALADLILECPLDEDPVDFLGSLGVPGKPFALTLMALQQAREATLEQRAEILEQNLEMALTNLRNDLRDLSKRRVMMAIVFAVLILLPTLMLTVLGPPMASLIGIINF